MKDIQNLKKVKGYEYSIFIEESLLEEIKKKIYKSNRIESIEELIIKLLEKEIK